MSNSKKGFKLVLSLIALFIIATFIISISSTVIAATTKYDVAYIYERSSKIDNNIVNTFKEMNFSVELLQVQNISKRNMSSYKFIFVGDEVFHGNLTQISEYPSIATSYYYGTEWGITDNDGISQLASNYPSLMLVNGTLMTAYTRAYYPTGAAIPYYFLPNRAKAPGFVQLAGTTQGQAGENLGDVVSIAEAGTLLENGNISKGRICFYGLVGSTYWTNISKQLLKDCAGYVSTRPIIECTTNNDCGASGLIDEPFCSSSTVISQNFLSFTCNNPGTVNSYCSNETLPAQIDTCSDYCAQGSCQTFVCTSDSQCTDGDDYTIDSCVNPSTPESYCNNTHITCITPDDAVCNDQNSYTEDICQNPGLLNSTCIHNPITCLSNSDCGVDRLIDSPYCSEGNLNQSFISFTCNNAGTTSSTCSNLTSSVLNTTCQFGCDNNACIAGLHDVSLVDFADSINKIKITDSTDMVVDSMICNQNYKIIIMANNTGNFTENITYSGSIGTIIFSHIKTDNLSPGASTSEKTRTVNVSLPEGAYNITVEAIISADSIPSNNIAIREINVSCPVAVINCTSDSQCNDQNSLTLDVCHNPGNVSSYCSNTPYACNDDFDCGQDFFGDNFCIGDILNRNLTYFRCLNPGTLVSTCTNYTFPTLVEPCAGFCNATASECQEVICSNNVQCNDSNEYTEDVCQNPGTIQSTCVHNPIECFDSEDCGQDGLLNGLFCTENNVSQLNIQFACNNAGTTSSTCSNMTFSTTTKICSSNQLCSQGACYNVTCSSNTDCDDQNVGTQDICNSPGQINSTCSNLPIACFSNSDCGTDGIVGTDHCSGNIVVDDYKAYTCNVPGNASSYCSSTTSHQTQETCSDYCSNGQCQTFACESNSDCGTNGFTGLLYCLGKNISQNYQTYSCINPSTPSARCEMTALPSTMSTCQYVCSSPGICTRCNTNSDCSDGNSRTIDTCQNPGTSQAQCVNDYVACFSNSDCGTDITCDNGGTPYCSGKNIVQDILTFKCNNAGQKTSYCSNTTQLAISTTCDFACYDAKCVAEESLLLVLDRKVNEGLYNYYCPSGYLATGARFDDEGITNADNFVYGLFCTKMGTLGSSNKVSLTSSGDYYCEDDQVVKGVQFHDNGGSGDNYITAMYCADMSSNLVLSKYIQIKNNVVPGQYYDYHCPSGEVLTGMKFNNNAPDNYVEGIYCSEIL